MMFPAEGRTGHSPTRTWRVRQLSSPAPSSSRETGGGLPDRLYRAIVDTAVDAIVVVDPKGAIRSVNRATERLFGYAAGALIGRDIETLMAEGEPRRADELRIGDKKVTTIAREVVGRRQDGSLFPMDLSIGEVQAGSEPIFVAMIRDISDRKAAELAQRESELRLRSIFDTIPDAIVVIDEGAIIQSFSPAAERLFGYSSTEAVGRNVKILMPTPYREAHDGFLERYLRTGERRIIGIGRVVVGLRKTGGELQVGEFAVAGARYFTGLVRDLTERHQAERRVQDLQSELLHASRLSVMGQMASTMAHELTQPLTAVTNYLAAGRQLLASGVGSPERVGEIMEKSIAQAQRAGEVIRRLRGFVSKGEPERKSQNLNRLVEEALALALVGAGQHGVRVTLELDPALPALCVDPVQIQQVVVNLVRNAIEAMEQVERRELVIGTRAISDERAAEVLVADSGPGIAPQLADRLFQPFFTTKKSGMGLGLSICREIVEAHHGRLSAAPGAAGGTVFRLILPIACPEETDSGR